MRTDKTELWKSGGIAYHTYSKWQDVMTNLQDELEGQRTKQKRQEEAYKQDQISKRKTLSGIGKITLPTLEDSMGFQFWDQTLSEVLKIIE